MLNDVCRRVKQQERKSAEDISVHGHNSAEFTWKNAYDRIDDMENAGASGRDFPLNFRQLRWALQDCMNVFVERCVCMRAHYVVGYILYYNQISSTLDTP